MNQPSLTRQMHVLAVSFATNFSDAACSNFLEASTEETLQIIFNKNTSSIYFKIYLTIFVYYTPSYHFFQDFIGNYTHIHLYYMY